MWGRGPALRKQIFRFIFCEFRADQMIIFGAILISVNNFANFFLTLSANGDGAKFH